MNALQKQIEKSKIKLSEQQILDSINRISKLFAADFTFGIYDVDDIIQECFIIAIKQLSKFKKSKWSKKSGDLQYKLECFLYVVLLNRIKNLKRDKFCRTDPPCIKCHREQPCYNGSFCEEYLNWKNNNNKKMSVANPYSLSYSLNDDGNDDSKAISREKIEHDFECDQSEKLLGQIENKDIINLIRSKLPKHMIDDFDSIRQGISIGHRRKHLLLNYIREIL